MTALGSALLGILARAPLSGYDIARQLREPLGYFWQAGHSQIYPELARLQADGLVTHQVVPQRDRPDKKVYSITKDGLETLRRWATAPLATPAIRDELVLKAYSLWLADPTAAVSLFREHERLHGEQLTRYERFRDEMERSYGADLERIDSPHFATFATLQRGIGYEREYAAWCRWLADCLARTHQSRLPGG